MSAETTVLLLEPVTLPASLDEQLAKRDVLTEHALLSTIAKVIPVLSPDLIVTSGDIDLTTTLDYLRREKCPAALVVIADRGTIRRLRAEAHEVIKALIPEDLPVAAVAHRIATMARRCADGSPLEHAPSSTDAKSGEAQTSPPAITQAVAPLSSSKVTSLVPSEAFLRRESAPESSERGSLAPLPLAPVQEVKIFDNEDDAASAIEFRREEIEQEARERLALQRAEADQLAFEEERRKKNAAKTAQASALAEKRAAEIKNRAEAAERRAAEAKARSAEARKKAEQRRLERGGAPSQRGETLSEEATVVAARPEEQRKAKIEKQKVIPAKSSSLSALNTPSELRALDGLFPSEAKPEDDVFELETQSVDVSAFAKKAVVLDREAEAESSRRLTSKSPTSREPARPSMPAEKKDAFAAVRKNDDLSVIMPLPVELRLPLAPQSDKFSDLRLALLDTDLTRADAVCAALREKGMKIHPVTPDPSMTRWPLLRRFAPQGLIVDEKSMARGAAEWVETFRGDPFLRHVPVVLVRFSRLFHEGSSEVTLEPLLHLIEPLGREEFALLEKLSPGRQVDLWLNQLPPFRLVQMLTLGDRNIRLDCRSEHERMVWHLGPGYAGNGKLADLASGAPKARLSPENSLLWLLSHEDCRVSVHEHAEPLAHASESKDSEQLLREMTDALAAPSRHESVAPGAGDGAWGNLQMPRAAAVPTTVDVSSQTPTPTKAVAPRQHDRTPTPSQDTPSALTSARKPLMTAERKEQLERLKQSLLQAMTTGQARTRVLWNTYAKAVSTAAAPLAPKVPPKVLRLLPAALPIFLFLVVLLALSLSGRATQNEQQTAELEAKDQENSRKDAHSEDTARNKAADASAKKNAAGSPDAREEKPASVNIWTAPTSAELPTCEARLGGAAPEREDRAKAIGYEKNARRLLMAGKTEDAVETMCLSGLYHKTGPAAEGLAEYYLGRRSLKEAERWIRLSLEGRPNRRQSSEILSDIENQKGNIDEARRVLLETMRLDGTETQKMKATSRKLMQDAELARKSGDLPRAEREIRRAAVLAPDDAVVAATLGEVLFKRGAADAAALWATHAIQLDSDYSVAKLLAGRIKEAQGKKDEARTFYEMIPIGDPYHSQAQRLRNRL